MVVWCNTERFNSALLRITENSEKQLMISLLNSDLYELDCNDRGMYFMFRLHIPRY